MTEGRLDGETPSLGLQVANRVAYWLVFRNIRRMLGLDRCRIAFTGAAPIAPDLIRWYLALGIDMREVYGQTENCGVAHPDAVGSHQARLGREGRPVGRGQDLARRRNPDQGRLFVHGISETSPKRPPRPSTPKDGCTPATSARSTMRALSRSPTG